MCVCVCVCVCMCVHVNVCVCVCVWCSYGASVYMTFVSDECLPSCVNRKWA